MKVPACILILFLSVSPLLAQDVLREQLNNGMTLIVREDHLTPAVSVVLSVRSAPLYEEDLLGSGASELLRRLKIHARTPALEKLLQQSGQRLAGHTTAQYTTFSTETTQAHVGTSLQLLAGIISNRSYGQEDFDRQRQALLSAQQLRNNNIDFHISNGLKKAFYRQPAQVVAPAGEPMPLMRLNLAALKQYDQRRYMSGNLVLVVNGNVATKEVKNLARQAFSVVPQGFASDHLMNDEPVMHDSRSITIEEQVDNPLLVLAWRTEVMSHENQAILGIMANYLNSENSPLRQALVNQQLVDSLVVRNVKTIGVPGYIEIKVGLRNEETQRVLTIMAETLMELQEVPIDDEFLQQMQKQMRRDYLLQKLDSTRYAEELLRWELETGSPLYGDELVKSRKRIRAIHLKKAAQLYFRSSHSCKIIVKSPPIEGTPQLIETTKPLTAVAPDHTFLDNGVHVIERPMPMELVHIILSLGVDVSEERYQGINELLTRILTLRTSTRSAEDLNELLAQKGMRLRASNTINAIQLHITCFPEDTLPAIGILADCITRPNFQEAELETHRQQLYEYIAEKKSGSSWQQQIHGRMLKDLFADHYVSRPTYGSVDTLKDINVKLLHDHLRRLVSGPNVVMSVYGSYDQKKTAAFLRQHISNARLFPKGQVFQPSGSGWDDFKTRSGNMDGDRHALAVAWRAPSTKDILKDRVAMNVLVAMLAGANGHGGFIGTTIAKKKSDPFIYTDLFVERYDQRGIWGVVAQVDKEAAPAARELILDAVKKGVEDVFKPQAKHLEQLLVQAKDICKTNFLLKEKDQHAVSVNHAFTVLQYGDLANHTEYLNMLSEITINDIKRIAKLYASAPAYILQMAPNQESAVIEKNKKEIKTEEKTN